MPAAVRPGAPGIMLADRTTRTDGDGDTGTVDMGYHYAEGVTLFKLTAQVLPDAADGMVHGTITPSFALVYEGSADNVRSRSRSSPTTAGRSRSGRARTMTPRRAWINSVTLTRGSAA